MARPFCVGTAAGGLIDVVEILNLPPPQTPPAISMAGIPYRAEDRTVLKNAGLVTTGQPMADPYRRHYVGEDVGANHWLSRISVPNAPDSQQYLARLEPVLSSAIKREGLKSSHIPIFWGCLPFRWRGGTGGCECYSTEYDRSPLPAWDVAAGDLIGCPYIFCLMLRALEEPAPLEALLLPEVAIVVIAA